MKAELQLLLAEIKRLGNNQHQLHQDIAKLETSEVTKACKPDLKKNGCVVVPCPGPVWTVLPKAHHISNSSDWSDGPVETPVRNIVSGEAARLAISQPTYAVHAANLISTHSMTDHCVQKLRCPIPELHTLTEWCKTAWSFDPS